MTATNIIAIMSSQYVKTDVQLHAVLCDSRGDSIRKPNVSTTR